MFQVGEVYNPFRLFYGSFIPNGILKCRELSATSKLAFGRLCQYAGENGLAYPSYATLGNQVGVDRRQAIRAVKELEKFGLIRPVRRWRDDGSTCSNSFEFLWHSIFDESTRGVGEAGGGVINDTSGGVINDTVPQCHTRHHGVSGVAPKQIHTTKKMINKKTTDEIREVFTGTPLLKITDEELKILAERHGMERLAMIADVAAETWRGKRIEIKNPGGYIQALCMNFIPPKWYEPLQKRKAKAVKMEERRREANTKDLLEVAVVDREAQEKNSHWNALSEVEQENFKFSVKSTLSPAGNWPAAAITSLAKNMAWEEGKM